VKRNPSALAEAFFEDSSATPSRPKDVPNTGTLYGTWWHEFVELLDWSVGAPFVACNLCAGADGIA
jgi:hypothetical protein